jgi:hypothetical protein
VFAGGYICSYDVARLKTEVELAPGVVMDRKAYLSVPHIWRDPSPHA